MRLSKKHKKMAIMKVSANGKVYEYDRKTVFVTSDLHKEMKQMALENDQTLQELVRDAFKVYKKAQK